MYIRETNVKNTIGIHGRPLTFFLDDAAKFKSSIWIEKTGEARRVNAKSMMGVLSLGIAPGEHIKIIAEGDDEKEAVDYIVGQVESNFSDHT